MAGTDTRTCLIVWWARTATSSRGAHSVQKLPAGEAEPPFKNKYTAAHDERKRTVIRCVRRAPHAKIGSRAPICNWCPSVCLRVRLSVSAHVHAIMLPASLTNPRMASTSLTTRVESPGGRAFRACRCHQTHAGMRWLHVCAGRQTLYHHWAPSCWSLLA